MLAIEVLVISNRSIQTATEMHVSWEPKNVKGLVPLKSSYRLLLIFSGAGRPVRCS